MHALSELEHSQMRTDHPRFPGGRHGPGARENQGRREGTRAGIRRRRDRQEGRRPAILLHREKDVFRAGSRTNLSPALSYHRKNRAGSKRSRAEGQTLLPPQPPRESGQNQGTQSLLTRSAFAGQGLGTILRSRRAFQVHSARHSCRLHPPAPPTQPAFLTGTLGK